MSPRFKNGRKARLPDRKFKRTRRRKTISITLICLVVIPGGIYLLQHFVELSWRLSSTKLREPEDDFDADLVYSKARALIEEGKANEFRGRRAVVTEKFTEALTLLEMIRKEDPHYKREEVAKAKIELENKLRKTK